MLENGKTMPSIDAWLREAKADSSAPACGMYLTHNGVVRATPKSEARGIETGGVAPGHRVGGMVFDYDAEKVQAAIEATRAMPGIGYVRVWLASGELAVGDDIMLVLIGGDIRPHVFNQSASGLFRALENLGIAWRYTRVASLGLMVMLWKRFSMYSLSKYCP